MLPPHSYQRPAGHAFTAWHPRSRDGVVLWHRRSVLRAGLAGVAGLTLPRLLQCEQARAATASRQVGPRSVILIWMTGGPSHIDTWDPKPERPPEIRGPFGTITTALPGVRLCEYLPQQAALLDRLTLIRSVDATGSNHEPNQVFQTGNLTAEPRTNREAPLYPAIASIAAKQLGPNQPGMPPSVALNMQDRSHLAWGGYLGRRYDPFVAGDAARLFQLPGGLDQQRLASRQELRGQFDRLRRDLDRGGSLAAWDDFSQQAVEMVTGPRAQEAFDLSREPAAVRARYGEHPWCQQALLARRLVESGVRFVTIDLSRHSASGTWDTHGDNIPPYGGIWNGLRPLLPVFDHLLATLVTDLHERGLTDQVLVIAMGEFGRTPKIGTQGSSDGRDHWPSVMSLTLAGGGLRHGQVIGSSDRDGATPLDRPVRPGDLAATIYRFLGVPLETAYVDFRGRPRPIVEAGEPIAELF